MILLALVVFVRAYSISFIETRKNILEFKSSEVATADCGIVLTGGPGRIQHGVFLLGKGAIRKLIISGVSTKASLRDLFPLWPVYGSISQDNVILEKRSETTYGNAIQSLAIAEALLCTNAFLITSQSHLYRAHRTFVGIFPTGFQIWPQSGDDSLSEADVWIEVLKTQFYNLFFLKESE